MKYNFIQTLGKFKSYELAQDEMPNGTFKAQLATGNDGSSRMILTKKNEVGDIKIGQWTFSKVIDLSPVNRGFCTCRIEGINPEGEEFAISKTFAVHTINRLDMPLNYILMVCALDGLGNANAVFECLSRYTARQPQFLEKELAELERILGIIDGDSERSYQDSSFDEWMRRIVTSCIRQLEKSIEENKK